MFFTRIEKRRLAYDRTEIVKTRVCIANKDILRFEATPQMVLGDDGTEIPCAIVRYHTLQPNGKYIERYLVVEGTATTLQDELTPEKATGISPSAVTPDCGSVGTETPEDPETTPKKRK